MLDDLSSMQDADNDPMLEQLVQATQQLNRQINNCIQDDASSSCYTGTPYLVVFVLTWKRSLEYKNPVYLPLYNHFLKPSTKFLSPT